MRILILGAAGMIGARLAARLVADGHLNGRAITGLHLVDHVAPVAPAEAPMPVLAEQADITDAGVCMRLAGDRPDVVFHLAAVVSGEAEMDLDKGYRVNVSATWALIEAFRRQEHVPRLVFASSLAVYGPPLPDPVPDEFHLRPASSYGTQKAIGEALMLDYSRRRLLDAIAIRLPTIVVRPGRPNAAASGFLSGIIREPLAGQTARLPVGSDVTAFIASPRIAVETFIHAAGLPSDLPAADRALTSCGLTISVEAMIETLRAVAGSHVVARITPEPDALVDRLVRSWPRAMRTDTARRLGFPADPDFETIVRTHIAHELDGIIH
jgi:nucleoside-diphosphate-sugar epimerase